MCDTVQGVENRGCAMERISPLRASLDAFNKFKNLRKEDFEKYYIVYSWGDSPVFKSILELDLRGH